MARPASFFSGCFFNAALEWSESLGMAHPKTYGTACILLFRMFHWILCFIGCCVSPDALAYRVQKKVHRSAGGGARKRWRTGEVEHRMLCFIGCCVSSGAVFHRMLWCVGYNVKNTPTGEVAHGRGGARRGWNFRC